jgi:hypothetical protein
MDTDDGDDGVPLEIWSEILQYLPREHHRILAMVCQNFRELTFRVVWRRWILTDARRNELKTVTAFYRNQTDAFASPFPFVKEMIIDCSDCVDLSCLEKCGFKLEKLVVRKLNSRMLISSLCEALQPRQVYIHDYCRVSDVALLPPSVEKLCLSFDFLYGARTSHTFSNLKEIEWMYSLPEYAGDYTHERTLVKRINLGIHPSRTSSFQSRIRTSEALRLYNFPNATIIHLDESYKKMFTAPLKEALDLLMMIPTVNKVIITMGHAWLLQHMTSQITHLAWKGKCDDDVSHEEKRDIVRVLKSISNRALVVKFKDSFGDEINALSNCFCDIESGTFSSALWMDL